MASSPSFYLPSIPQASWSRVHTSQIPKVDLCQSPACEDLRCRLVGHPRQRQCYRAGLQALPSRSWVGGTQMGTDAQSAASAEIAHGAGRPVARAGRDPQRPGRRRLPHGAAARLRAGRAARARVRQQGRGHQARRSRLGDEFELRAMASGHDVGPDLSQELSNPVDQDLLGGFGWPRFSD